MCRYGRKIGSAHRWVAAAAGASTASRAGPEQCPPPCRLNGQLCAACRHRRLLLPGRAAGGRDPARKAVHTTPPFPALFPSLSGVMPLPCASPGCPRALPARERALPAQGKAIAVQQHQDIIAANHAAKAAGVAKHMAPAEVRRGSTSGNRTKRDQLQTVAEVPLRRGDAARGMGGPESIPRLHRVCWHVKGTGPTPWSPHHHHHPAPPSTGAALACLRGRAGGARPPGGGRQGELPAIQVGREQGQQQGVRALLGRLDPQRQASWVCGLSASPLQQRSPAGDLPARLTRTPPALPCRVCKPAGLAFRAAGSCQRAC